MIAQVNLDQGLVGYYSFDNGDAQDQSSGNLHGILHGNPTPIPGISGSAFFFDGVDDYIEIPDELNFQADFTITMWVNAITQGVLVFKGENCPDGNPNFQGNSYNLTLGRKYNGCYSTDPNTSFHIRGQLIETGGNFFDDRIMLSSEETVIQPKSFTFLAFCYDATTKKFRVQLNGMPLLDTELNHFYEDGGSSFCEVIAPDDISTAHLTSSSLTIGAREDWCGSIYKINGFYQGVIDEVRFYDRKLNSEELDILSDPPIISSTTLEEKPEISCYPNPTNGSIHIYNPSMTLKHIEVYSIDGHQIPFIWSSAEQTIQVDYTGVVIVQFLVGSKVYSQKIVVQ